jgi:hypothetical protein
MAYIGIPQIPGLTILREAREYGSSAGVKKAWQTRRTGVGELHADRNMVMFRGQRFNPYDDDHPLHDAYWDAVENPPGTTKGPRSQAQRKKKRV